MSGDINVTNSYFLFALSQTARNPPHVNQVQEVQGVTDHQTSGLAPSLRLTHGSRQSDPLFCCPVKSAPSGGQYKNILVSQEKFVLIIGCFCQMLVCYWDQ